MTTTADPTPETSAPEELDLEPFQRRFDLGLTVPADVPPLIREVMRLRNAEAKRRATNLAAVNRASPGMARFMLRLSEFHELLMSKTTAKRSWTVLDYELAEQRKQARKDLRARLREAEKETP